MTKSQFQQLLAERSNITKQQAAVVLETLGELVQEALTKEGKVSIPELVKFSLKEVAAKPEREGRNPFTGEAITLKAKPAAKKVGASPTGALKKAFA